MEKIDWCDWKFGGVEGRQIVACAKGKSIGEIFLCVNRRERGELRFLASQDRQYYILYFISHIQFTLTTIQSPIATVLFR
jgi:hypothetical protein